MQDSSNFYSNILRKSFLKNYTLLEGQLSLIELLPSISSLLAFIWAKAFCFDFFSFSSNVFRYSFNSFSNLSPFFLFNSSEYKNKFCASLLFRRLSIYSFNFALHLSWNLLTISWNNCEATSAKNLFCAPSFNFEFYFY